MPSATPDQPNKPQANVPQRMKDRINKGLKALPQFKADQAKIEQEPHPLKRYLAHTKLKADHDTWLADPTFADHVQKADEKAAKALGLVLADPKKRKKLEAIATTHEGGGGGGGGGGDGGDDEEPAKAEAKPAGGGHAMKRATQGLQAAQQNHHAVLDDPHSTNAQLREAQDEERRWKDSVDVAKNPPDGPPARVQPPGNPPAAAPVPTGTPKGRGGPPAPLGAQAQPDADSGD